MIDRIALVTDFGTSGPYVGQMKLHLAELAPRIPVIELVSDCVPFRSDLAAYLLPALVRDMPIPSLYLCVVDPGVGGERAVLAVLADGSWYVGPDNGLLALVARRAKDVRILRVDWRPPRLSATFHGRDLFAPVGAMLCAGRVPACTEIDLEAIIGSGWPDDLPCIVYTDAFGNLMTGLRAVSVDRGAILEAGGRKLGYARTFGDVAAGAAFWNENSLGLVELAVNQGNASHSLGLAPGDAIGL